MWIWTAMLDLKVHVLHGVSFRAGRGPVLVLIALGAVAITAVRTARSKARTSVS